MNIRRFVAFIPLGTILYLAGYQSAFAQLGTGLGPPVAGGTGDVTVINDETSPVPVAFVDDYVSLRMTGKWSGAVIGLFDQLTGSIPQLDMSQFGGRDLLVEYVSCQVIHPNSATPNFYISENGQDAPDDAVIAIKLSAQGRALAKDGVTGDAFHASHTVKVIVESTDVLFLIGRRGGGTINPGRASCVIAGRLVN